MKNSSKSGNINSNNNNNPHDITRSASTNASDSISPTFKNKNPGCILVKQKISSQNDHSIFNAFLTNFQNETTRYHLMKNKIYLLCQDNKKLVIYNIFKLKKIAEWDLNKNQMRE